jgi:Skp family chaperone for outer membrane proteins
MSSDTIISAKGMLRITGEWLDKMEVQVARVHREIDEANARRGQLELERQEHEKWKADTVAACKTECDALKREVANERAAAAAEMREAKALWAKATAHEAAVANRAADLQQRYSGAPV